MPCLYKVLRTAIVCCLALFGLQIQAADLKEIKERGVLRHLGIRYANFVTGTGDGFDVELVKGFAEQIGVKYELVYTDFYSVIRDLLGKDVSITNEGVKLSGNHPIRGDLIATGFTVLPWRQEVLLFSKPTFPSQVVLIAPATSSLKPIPGTNSLLKDITDTKKLIGSKSLLVMERTCLDPGNYGLKDIGLSLKRYTKSTNINEMVPALLNGEAELSLLDVPDLLIDLKKWPAKFKVIGPISDHQDLAAAFPKDAPELRNSFNEYLNSIQKMENIQNWSINIIQEYTSISLNFSDPLVERLHQRHDKISHPKELGENNCADWFIGVHLAACFTFP